MERDRHGHWRTSMHPYEPGMLYRYRLDGNVDCPDPASHFQPHGVHGASSVVDHGAFPWTDDAWKGIGLEEMILYELHVGAFTPEGTFEAIIPRLSALKDLGITAVEIMPVGQFPGERDWGYDGVFPFAVQNSYGGPDGLKRLVDACHAHGLAVALDVVYNHLGPEGNYLPEFGPYFTERYRTAWGTAVNFDGRGSDEVRNYFIENALLWLREYHIDTLRVDAVHAIYDTSAVPFLAQLTSAVRDFGRSTGRRTVVIAESAQNDAKIIRARGGFGFDAFWSDDFHHSLHAVLTGEKEGYYQDYGPSDRLVRCLRNGLWFTGQYSRYRGRRHGTPSFYASPERFVVFSQNHDQVGNRLRSERLSALVPFEAAKTAAAVVLLSPYVPLLFMGEEYAETSPFPFFFSYSDHGLSDAVRKGRRKEFEAFSWAGTPPDPADPGTYMSAKLHWELRSEDAHRRMLQFYSELLRLRREEPALRSMAKDSYRVVPTPARSVLFLVRSGGGSRILIGFNVTPNRVVSPYPEKEGKWRKILDSEADAWGDPALAAPASLSPGRALVFHPFQTVAFKIDRRDAGAQTDRY